MVAVGQFQRAEVQLETFGHGEAIAVDVPGALTLDSTGLAVALAQAGAGLAYLPEPCVTPLVRAGALRCVLGDWSASGAAFHLYYSGRRQLPTGLRLLIALIREMRPLGF